MSDHLNEIIEKALQRMVYVTHHADHCDRGHNISCICDLRAVAEAAHEVGRLAGLNEASLGGQKVGATSTYNYVVAIGERRGRRCGRRDFAREALAKFDETEKEGGRNYTHFVEDFVNIYRSWLREEAVE